MSTLTTDAHPAADPVKPTITITPPGGWQPIDLKELWAYRDMIWRMTLRDIKSRYKQSALGPTWVIVIPLLQTGIFSVIFGWLAGLPSGDIPYPIFIYSGMLIWTQFSRAFSTSSNCIATNEHLITKVYFPRLVAPLASVAGSILDLILGLVVLTVLLVAANLLMGEPDAAELTAAGPVATSAVEAGETPAPVDINLPTPVDTPPVENGAAATAGATDDTAAAPAKPKIRGSIAPNWHIVFAPLYIILSMVAALSIGIWIACFAVRFRDLRYAAPFVVQLLMWLTPVAYSSVLVMNNPNMPEQWQPYIEAGFQLNPMFQAVEGFRWSLLNYEPGQPTVWTAVSVACTLVVLVTGLYYFRHVDSTVADVI